MSELSNLLMFDGHELEIIIMYILKKTFRDQQFHFKVFFFIFLFLLNLTKNSISFGQSEKECLKCCTTMRDT